VERRTIGLNWAPCDRLDVRRSGERGLISRKGGIWSEQDLKISEPGQLSELIASLIDYETFRRDGKVGV
jgi:hypothetical protein